MSRKARRRKKKPTGLLGWFRSQDNITKVIYWIVAFIFVGGAFVGFGGALGGGSSCSPQGSQLTPEEKARMKEPVATVGDTSITRQEYEVEWMQASERDKLPEDQAIYVPPPEDSYISRFLALDRMMMMSMIKQEAAKRGITVEQSEIDEQVEQIKSNVLNMSPDEQAKRSLFQRMGDALNKAKSGRNYRARLWDMARITPEQLESRIVEDKLQQKFSEAFRDEVKNELDEEAKQKADMIMGKLNEGADFEALVAEYSDDSATKATGGRVDNVKRAGDEPPEIVNNAFSAAVGEILPPFKVREEMQNPFQQGAEPLVFESYVILEVLEQRLAEGDAFETEKETIRETLRNEKWEEEKKTNPDLALEDVDVGDEDIENDYEQVSYRIIKVDSYNFSLASERSQKKIEELRETYNMQVLDPGLNAWKLLRDGDFEEARNEWALFFTEAEASLSDDKFLAMDEIEQEAAQESLDERLANLNYINGLMYRIEIEGYKSIRYQYSITGLKDERSRERWDKYNEDPEAYGEEEPNLQEPTEEEKAEYLSLNEEALPFFDKALEVIDADAYIYLHRAETEIDLEKYEPALDDLEAAAEYASDDLSLNQRIDTGISALIGMFGDQALTDRVMALGATVGEKVDRLNAEMQKRRQEQQAAQGGQNFGG